MTISNARVAVRIATVSLLVGCSPPNVEELDKDLNEADARLLQIETELAEFEGGLIHSLLLTRRNLASVTKEMLQQKRASLLYWIQLEYPVNGQVYVPARTEDLEPIVAEIDELESQVETAELEAKFSGGLIGTLKKAEVATLKLSVATVRHRYFAEKYGVPVVFSSSKKNESETRTLIDPNEL